jgi:hypothetical protein
MTRVMETIWRFTFHPRGRVDLVPLVADGMLYLVSDYSVWCHNLRRGYYYFRAPILGRTRRLLFPERGWVRRFLSYRGLLYLMLVDRFGKNTDVVFDPAQQCVIKADVGPLYRAVRYIFKSGVKVERCFVDGKFRDGVTAHLHHEKTFLWTSGDKIRPAIKYTEVVGDVLSVGEAIIVCQNYFSRRRHMPAGFSITGFHHLTGEIMWNIESYTYSHRLHPFAVVADIMYVTGGGHKDGFFRKIDLTSGKVLANETLRAIDSGVTYHEGVFYFGEGGDVAAVGA